MVQRQRTTLPPPRHGVALVVVLVVIVLLSLAAYTFTEMMVLEAEASEFAARRARARVCADSAIEYAAAILGNRSEASDAVNLYHDPTAFAGVPVSVDGSSPTPGLFTILAPVESDAGAEQVRFGLIDESGKLNLNAVHSLNLDDEEVRQMLLAIPGMTDEAADGVLDWVDEDDEPRPCGAESDFYASLSPPHITKNGPLETLDELLLVRGVTPELLYGEDANRNGLLDPNEDDGALSLPVDNADGLLDPGWSAYLTVYSGESNLRSDGEPRIDINDSTLVDLYDALEEALGADEARFIVAYRMFGATNVPSFDPDHDPDTEQALRAFSRGVTAQLASEPVSRGGMNLSAGATVEVESLYELVDAEVEAEMESGGKETLSSPWTSDAASLAEAFPRLLGNVSTVRSESIEGRININQARPEVLLGIPAMDRQLAEAIVTAQPVSLSEPDSLLIRRTTAWLLAEGLADVTTMRQLDRYITARGDVYRLQALGHFDGRGPVSRVEAVIDATSYPPRIISRRDLSELGPGYEIQGILQTVNSASTMSR